MITAIWVTFLLLAVWIGIGLYKDFIKHKNQLEDNSWAKTGFIGFIANFFDTLGIGSFAIETALFKLWKQSEDRLIPGTLNAANALPTIAQAIIFIQIVEVDPLTLVLMLVASVAGAILGAGIVARWPEKNIQVTMGVALLITAGFLLSKIFAFEQQGGTAIGLEGPKLFLAVGVNFILGALMTAGIGLYAPCMALVALLGMSPQTAFPIMMGSCAMLMPLAGLRFIREGAYNRRASVAIAITGVIGVLIAAFLVKKLPIEYLRWLVVLVVVYTAVAMLRSAYKKKVIS